MYCAQCGQDVPESHLHKHFRLQHGLLRAGIDKVTRSVEQSPNYDHMRLNLTAGNFREIFTRYLIAEYNQVKAQLSSIGLPHTVLPQQNLSVTYGGNKLTLTPGKI